MNPTSTSLETLAFNCDYSVSLVVMVGLLLCAVFAWLLFRERHVVGNVWAFVFWVLRSSALAVLIWMFLQPDSVVETKTSIPQTVAIVADRSDSMNVVDDPSEGQGPGWQIATSLDESRNPQVAIDSALVAVEVAVHQWEGAQQILQQGFDASMFRDQLENAEFALKRAAEQLLDDALANSNEANRAGDFAISLKDLAEAANELSEEVFRKSGSNEATDLSRWIVESEASLDSLQETQRLAKSWQRSVRQQLAADTDLANDQTRQAQVASLINVAIDDALSSGSEALQVQHFHFDQNLVSALGSGGNESDADSIEPSFDVDNETADQQPGTNLSAAMEQLHQIADQQSIKSAIFLTDGGHNIADETSPAEVAIRNNHFPVSFVPIGSLKARRDLQIYHVEHPRSVAKGDKIAIEALVSSVGFQGETIVLQLRADGEVFDEHEVFLDSDILDIKRSFSFPTEEPGTIEFELSIEPLEDEASQSNNVSLFRVNVVRDKIKVLLADRISRWEYRYLDQLLFRDKHIDYEFILYEPRLRASGALREAGRLPETVDGWGAYDVAILGDLNPEQFSVEAQRSLSEHIKRKGGIAILMAGRNGMPGAFSKEPLADLLPVQATSAVASLKQEHRVRMNRTASGSEALHLDRSLHQSEALWDQVYREQPITWLSEYCLPKPSARRLLDALPLDEESANPSGSDVPAWVCWQKIGAGKVVYFAAPDTYRLRFRRGDVLHHRFWGQLLRWLTSGDPGSRTDQIQLVTDKVRYLDHEPIETTVLLSDADGQPMSVDGLSVEFVDHAGAIETFALAPDENQPGRYRVTVDQLPPGAWRASVKSEAIDNMLGDNDEDQEKSESAETFVNVVQAPNVELVNTVCNRPLMRQIAKTTGGYVIPPTAFAELIRLQAGTPETTSTIQRKPLWNRWSCLWLALGCLFTEWIVRRVKGLT